MSLVASARLDGGGGSEIHADHVDCYWPFRRNAPFRQRRLISACRILIDRPISSRD